MKMKEAFDSNSVLRSESMREMLNKKPDFLQKWALLIFMLIFLAIIASCWYIQYPDKIEANAILTAGDTCIHAQITITQNNLNKLDTGLQVQLQLATYPYQQFGFIPGELRYISKVATDSGYPATILLTQGLRTDHNFQVPCKGTQKATVIIITHNVRLLEKLYSSFAEAVRNK
jgi:hypothetical protein